MCKEMIRFFQGRPKIRVRTSFQSNTNAVQKKKKKSNPNTFKVLRSYDSLIDGVIGASLMGVASFTDDSSIDACLIIVRNTISWGA